MIIEQLLDGGVAIFSKGRVPKKLGSGGLEGKEWELQKAEKGVCNHKTLHICMKFSKKNKSKI